MQEPVPDPVHRNSLGYVVGKALRGGEGPQIVWARDGSGGKVSIEDASSGGGQGLTCVCGAELIGRKGAERAHHFAHASGSSGGCEDARTAAIGEFVLSAIGGLGRVALAERGARPETVEVRAESYSVHNGVVVVRLIHGSGAELDMALATRPRDVHRCRRLDWSKARRSAMLVSLVGYQSLGDRELAEAIVAGGRREWLEDRKPGRRWRSAGKDRAVEGESVQDVEECEGGMGSGRDGDMPGIAKAAAPGGGKRQMLGEDFTERLETLFPAEVEKAYLNMKYRRNRRDRR